MADYTTGGIARYGLQLARALAGLEAPERFTLLRGARPKLAAEPLAGLATRRLLTPPHHRLEQFTLPLELVRPRPDVLHSIDFIPPFWRTFKSVITVHDLGFLRFPRTLTGPSRRYYGQIERAVRSAERIIAVSECTRDDLIRLARADPSKIDVVSEAAGPSFRPVRSAELLAAARRRLGCDARPYVLFVGSLEPRKNLIVLLEAFARVRRELDAQLALVGRRGWLYAPILRRRAELGLEGHTRLVEDVQDAELPAIYSGAAVFAFPSLYEGFGLPVVEAMACGCPVVASDRAALPEIVGQAGLLVPPDDVDALATALLRVLTEPERRAELVRRGLERAAEFCWRRAAAETLAVYRKAVG